MISIRLIMTIHKVRQVLFQGRVLPLSIPQGQTERHAGIQGLTVGRSLSAGTQLLGQGEGLTREAWRGKREEGQ